jgi:hypothetical protein
MTLNRVRMAHCSSCRLALLFQELQGEAKARVRVEKERDAALSSKNEAEKQKVCADRAGSRLSVAGLSRSALSAVVCCCRACWRCAQFVAHPPSRGSCLVYSTRLTAVLFVTQNWLRDEMKNLSKSFEALRRDGETDEKMIKKQQDEVRLALIPLPSTCIAFLELTRRCLSRFAMLLAHADFSVLRS